MRRVTGLLGFTKDAQGFTLVELLLVVVLLGLIVGPLITAFIFSLDSTAATQTRLAENQDAELVTRYWSLDARNVSSTSVATSDACGEVGSLAWPLITLSWNTDSRATEPPVYVTYEARGQGRNAQLVRKICVGGTGADVTPSDEIVISNSFAVSGDTTRTADSYFSTALPSCTASTCTLTIDGPNYDQSIVAQRRVQGNPIVLARPGAPKGVKVMEVGNKRVKIVWEPPAESTPAPGGYKVEAWSADGQTFIDDSGSDPAPLAPRTYMFTGLDNGTYYRFGVRAVTLGAEGGIVAVGPLSNLSDPAAPGMTAPDPPVLVAGSAAEGDVSVSTTAKVRWYLPEYYNNGGSPVTGFKIYTNGELKGTADLGNMVGTQYEGTANDLYPGTRYTLTVTALSALGESAHQGEPSNEIVTLPGAPTAIAADRADRAAVVSFASPANGGEPVVQYAATCMSSTGGAQGTATGTASPITVTGLDNGHRYTCLVVAWNYSAGEEPVLRQGPGSTQSNTVTPSTVPGAPTNAAGTRGGSEVNLTWVAPSDNGGAPIEDYEVTVYDSTGGAPTGVTGELTRRVGNQATDYTFTGLTNGTRYAFRVAAINVAGTGSQSVLSPAITPSTVPAAAKNVVGTRDDRAANLTWAAPSDNGGAPIEDYEVTVYDSTGGAPTGVTGELTRRVGNQATDYAFTGLTNGTTYTFGVAAINVAGAGPQSELSNAVGPATLPGAPTNIRASRDGSGRLSINFNAPPDGGDSIFVYTVTCASSNGGVMGTESAAITTVSVGGMTDGKDYTCTGTATNTVGTGPASVPSPRITVATAPNAPTGVSAVGPVEAKVSFTPPAWNGGLPITLYTATCNRTDGGGSTFASASASPITITAPPLVELKSYTCVVTATNDVGTGPQSAPSSSTFMLDSTPPVTSINFPVGMTTPQPSAGIYTASGWNAGCTSSICGTANDVGVGVASVKVSIRRNGGLYWNGSSFSSGSEVFVATGSTTAWGLLFPASNFPSGGVYVMRVQATDGNGNVSTESRTFGIDSDGDGYVPGGLPADCNDANATINPGMPDKPDLNFAADSDSNCDGIDGTEANAIFVVPGGGGSGTKTQPMGSVTNAISAAAASGKDVYVAAGTYTENQGAQLATGVGVYGGYDSGWDRSSSNETEIVGAPQAAFAEGDTGITIQSITLTASNGSQPAGASTYGLRAVGGSNVRLERVTATAENGVAGLTESPPGRAESGSSGGDGQSGRADSSSGGYGGNGGAGGGGTGRNGGGGGTGGYDSQNGYAGVQGIVQIAGQGGPGGAGGAKGSRGGLFTSCGDSGWGQLGSTGVSGSGGSGGTGGSNALNFAGVAWVGASGSAGSNGTYGHGGGGGGGGGGAGGWYCTADRGGGGGGGGGGGQGGQGGPGGQAGGGSFGIYAYGSVVTVDLGSVITPGSGGKGGDGARGGDGGGGGVGGKRGDRSSENAMGGGGGGAGGDGGAGGGGGGAAGGPGIGAFGRGGSTVSVLGGSRVDAGTGGQPGVGGGNGSAGMAGIGRISDIS